MQKSPIRWRVELFQRLSCLSPAPLRTPGFAAAIGTTATDQWRQHDGSEGILINGVDKKHGKTPQQLRDHRKSEMRKFFGDFSPEARKLRQEILYGRVEASSYVKDSISAGTVTIEIIRTCLDAEYLKKVTLQRHRSQATVPHVETEGIARAILLYIWSKEELWTSLLRDSSAIYQLCYFAVTEGLEDYIFQWMHLSPSEKGVELNIKGFRGQLLSFTATSMLAIDNKNATPALAFFFRAVKAKRRARQEHLQAVENGTRDSSDVHPITNFSSWPALVAMGKVFTLRTWPDTDPDLYDRFITAYNAICMRYWGPGVLHSYILSGLRLTHPTAPTAAPTLELFQEVMNQRTWKNPAEARHVFPATDGKIFRRLKMASDLLRREGRIADADWLLGLGKTFGIKKFIPEYR